MALYIRGDRILTEEEKNNEDGIWGTIILITLLICFIFVLAPGILITSHLTSYIDMSTSQLWGTAIVSSLAFLVILILLFGKEKCLKNYAIAASVCFGYMLLFYLFNNDCVYYKTIKEMFHIETKSSLTEGKTNEVKTNRSKPKKRKTKHKTKAKSRTRSKTRRFNRVYANASTVSYEYDWDIEVCQITFRVNGQVVG